MAGKKGRSGRPRKYPKKQNQKPLAFEVDSVPRKNVQEPKKPIFTIPEKKMVLPATSGQNLNAEIAKDAPQSGIDGLKRIKDEISGKGKSEPDASTPQAGTSPPGSGAGEAEPPKRTKFKTYRPEQTVKMVVRQYWRFRDWMARRQLGLPSEYAGVFIQKEDGLVTPLVEPLIGCIDAYLPEEWIVFIEEKSPIIHLFLAVFEVEQIFQSAVNDAKVELEKRKPQTKTSDEPKPKFPSLAETQGK